jgi:hypothetical protein
MMNKKQALFYSSFILAAFLFLPVLFDSERLAASSHWHMVSARMIVR